MSGMMRRLLIFAGMLLLTAGCSRDTAFEYFTKLDSTQERAVSNYRRVTLSDGNLTEAIVNVLYLNPVEPEMFRGNHYFFISLYDRDKRPLEEYNLTLNGEPPAGITMLDRNCSLSRLLPLNNPWTVYYEAVFKRLKDENLTLRFEIDPSLTGEAVYRSVQ